MVCGQIQAPATLPDLIWTRAELETNLLPLAGIEPLF